MSLSARTQIVEHLRDRLPGVTVLEFMRDLDDVQDVTVMAATRRINPGASAGFWAVTCELIVVARYEDYEHAERQLEDAIVDVLVALDQLPHVSLTAERVEVAGPDGTAKHHGFRVDLVVPVEKITDDTEETTP